MNVYLVGISADIPYPWPKEYRQTATNEGVAIARSLKAYRQDVRERNGKAKRIAAFTLSVRRLGNPERQQEEQTKHG